MSWGIIFNTTIKVNRLYIRDKIELQEKIKEQGNLQPMFDAQTEKILNAISEIKTKKHK